jgi:hypothetical protein
VAFFVKPLYCYVSDKNKQRHERNTTMRILTQAISIEKNLDQSICLLTSEQEAKLLEAGYLLKYRRCKLTFAHKTIEIACPELSCPELSEAVLILPDILIPHRPYPVYVYIYAVEMYSSTKMSQRAAAKEAQKKFQLKTFAHSTLGRAFGRIEEKSVKNIIELGDGTADAPACAAKPTPGSTGESTDEGGGQKSCAADDEDEGSPSRPTEGHGGETTVEKRKFPTLEEMDSRKANMSSCFAGWKAAPGKDGPAILGSSIQWIMELAGRYFVKYHRLLI